MENRKIFVGIDAGTDSIGYAVTDGEYRPIKFKGEPMLGVTVFESAKPSAERRGYRTARRRLDRVQQRVALTEELFAKEIAKLDPRFFIKRRESALFREDASDIGFALDGTDYNRKYPTIHHLIVELMQDDSPHDARLVFWACAWLMAHRGHFLSDVSPDNIEKLFEFNSIYDGFVEFINTYYDSSPWECDAESFSDVLKRKKGVTAKEKAFFELLFGGKKPKDDENALYNRATLIRLLCGGKVKAAELFNNEAYSEIASFALDTDEDMLASEVFAVLNEDDSQLILKLKAMFDWAILVDARRGKRTISEGKVDVYEQHTRDLAQIKRFVRKYLPGRYREIFREYDPKIPNYTAYVKNLKSAGSIETDKVSKVGKDAFSDYLKKQIKDASCDEADGSIKQSIIERLETRTFLPKQVDSDNRIIPYQLYYYELKRILKNASAYLPFLNEKDENGITAKEKLESVFTFRIPYFVGPLTGPNNGNSHAWIVRRSEGRIYPWNIEKLVDYDASEQAFIDRMTNRCTYLASASVLPKWSLLYSRFTVLNEINNIRINGEPISVECKQRLYRELFMKRKKVSAKHIEEALISGGEMRRGDTLEGIDVTVKSSLRSYHDFARLLAGGVLNEDDVERIIERRTYTEDNRRFKKWVDTEFPTLPAEERRYIASLKYSDFGRLSKELLNGLEGCRIADGTGEVHTVIHYLWETNDNLMQVLSDRYTFSDTIEKSNTAHDGGGKNLSARLDNMYISNAVKRPIIRLIELVKEIRKACGKDPDKIFIEMARGASEEQKNKRTESRADQIRRLYAFCKEDTAELSKQLEAMGAECDQRLRSESLFLYYMQLGRCMYTGKRIDVTRLKDGTYNVDHIYPQCFVKDDSILSNKVLVLSEANSDKGDEYPIPSKFRLDPQVRAHWEALHKAGLITDEKYHRLTRAKAFTDDEKLGFINRQLVETRQSTKAAAQLLKELYPDTEIVYVKAGLVSEFRSEFGMLKTRSVNDLHHAKDAYLNIVVGNVYHERFNKAWFSVQEKYNAQPKKLFEKPVTVNGRLVWNGGESIAFVRKIIGKNAIRFTRYAFTRKGGLFDQMPLRARAGLVPRKAGIDPAKYGGYNKTTAAFFMLVVFHTGKKKDAMFIPIELMHKDRYLADPEFAIAYSRQTVCSISNKAVSEISFPLGMRPIKINTVIELDGCRVCITGKSTGGKALGMTLNTNISIDSRLETYIKRLEKFSERKKKTPAAMIDEAYDEISAERNLELYDAYFAKLTGKPFNKILDSQISVLEKGRAVFEKLSIEEQTELLLQIVALLKTGRAGGCNLKLIGGVEKAGVLTLSSTLSNWKKKYDSAVIIDQSPAGLFEKRSKNLLELV
ncbi:MAG: type II CRISPR RNA-guided endonuclease Cas9 [Clostridia bacterium]|nr:type II CRISPR RNA-guided endonuclease Cas9 [Clostridia bacterium]